MVVYDTRVRGDSQIRYMDGQWVKFDRYGTRIDDGWIQYMDDGDPI